MSRIVTFMLCLLFGAGLTVVVLPAQAKPGDDVQACPDHLGNAASMVCICSAEAATAGTIWGADLYTDDSAICRAALHAGVISQGGGTISVFERPGQSDYPATTRNGVSSGHWPAWRRSIAFGNPVDMPMETRPRLAACPTNAVGLALGARLHCGCTIVAMVDGSIWGTDRYTADSAICHAARHAGAIGENGGEVSLRVIAGARDYPASIRDGVASSHWGSYARSYTFDR